LIERLAGGGGLNGARISIDAVAANAKIAAACAARGYAVVKACTSAASFMSRATISAF
jgi:hypothetical protein